MYTQLSWNIVESILLTRTQKKMLDSHILHHSIKHISTIRKLINIRATYFTRVIALWGQITSPVWTLNTAHALHQSASSLQTQSHIGQPLTSWGRGGGLCLRRTSRSVRTWPNHMWLGNGTAALTYGTCNSFKRRVSHSFQLREPRKEREALC